MKFFEKPYRKALVTAAVFLTIPMTLYALSGSSLSISNWGTFGCGNSVSGWSSVAIGTNNQVHGGRSLAVGYGLTVNSSQINATVIGKNNIPQNNALFIIGMGGSPSSKANALEVYDDGTVLLPIHQGDINMGIYE